MTSLLSARAQLVKVSPYLHLHLHIPRCPRPCPHRPHPVRTLSHTPSALKDAPRKPEPADKTDYNASPFASPEHTHYPRVTANDLEHSPSHTPPRSVTMLVRDFIEDSLYNPHYGYFTKQATIFEAPEPIRFEELRDAAEFEEVVARRYQAYGEDTQGPGKQLWHTPTELFKVRILSDVSDLTFDGRA